MDDDANDANDANDAHDANDANDDIAQPFNQSQPLVFLLHANIE